MADSEELAVLKTVARRLGEAGIAYMVTGSIAGNFYAVPRMTRDIDIVIELSNLEAGKFVRLFERDFYLEPETIRDAVKNRRMFNLIENRYLVKVDFVVRKDEPYRRMEFSRRQKIVLDDDSIYVVTPEDLILSKLHWAKDSESAMQMNDVRNLIGSAPQLDRRYLARWARALGIESLYKQVAK